MAEVVRLSDFREHQTNTGEIRRPETRLIGTPETGTDQTHIRDSRADKLSVEDLYPEPTLIGQDLSTAIQLLTEAVELINNAIEHERRNEQLHADDAMQRMQMVLPELFFCRSLGDGFGAIINGLFHALKNHGGSPLTEDQMMSIRSSLMTLQNEPFLEFAVAMEQIGSLQSLGFSVVPMGMEVIDRALAGLDEEKENDAHD